MNPNLLAMISITKTLADILDQRGNDDIAEYLRLSSELAGLGNQYVAELNQVAEKIQSLVNENRQPTALEYIEARRERARLSQELQSL